MSAETLGVTNFWMRRRKETEMLRVVSWAQFYGIRIEDLTEKNIRDAIETLRCVHPPEDEDD